MTLAMLGMDLSLLRTFGYVGNAWKLPDRIV